MVYEKEGLGEWGIAQIWNFLLGKKTPKKHILPIKHKMMNKSYSTKNSNFVQENLKKKKNYTHKKNPPD